LISFSKPNPSFNDLLTMYSNDKGGWWPTKTQRTLLQICYDINTVRRELFCRHDLGIFEPKFRYYRCVLGDIFKEVISGRPPHYQLRGLNVDNLTIKDTEVRKVSDDVLELLSKVKQQPPYFHDITITTPSVGLYDNLILNGYKPNFNNKQVIIKSDQIPIKSKFKTTITVNRNDNVTLHLGCTFNPIPFSFHGFNSLIEYLGQIVFVLRARAAINFEIPPVDDWMIRHIHLNKDKKVTKALDSPIFHYSIAEYQVSLQEYVKKFPNGKTAIRIEEKLSPNKTIQEQQIQAGDGEKNYVASFDDGKELYDV
jgi:hypothetical protein